MESDAWDQRYAGRELIWTAEPNRFLVAEVGDLAPGRALDVACGEGRNAVWLAERGWDVVGVDFSGVGLGKGRALAEARGVEVTWVRADVTTYQPEGTFDLVVVLYLHLGESGRRAALGRAAAVLAPGGTLLVVGHADTNLTDGVGGPQDPAVLYGPDDVTGALGDLVVDRAERVPRRVETDAGSATAIDTLVRARRPAAPAT